jgi:hypothetical protein
MGTYAPREFLNLLLEVYLKPLLLLLLHKLQPITKDKKSVVHYTTQPSRDQCFNHASRFDSG